MTHDFDISGYYYRRNALLCRKYLDIKQKDTKISKPDMMVVMMNPGSSKPLDGDDDGQILTKAKPDNTQYQIIKISQLCGYSFARVLNLSDIREPKSQIFFDLIQTADSSHSIFDDSRADDFTELFVRDVPVIFAWGVDKKLQLLADMAIDKIQATKPIGILKDGTHSAYYHPLPQNYDRQKQWLENIYNKLRK